MARVKTKGEGVSAGDPAPIYDNVRSMADFIAMEVGRELARCARFCPDLWDEVYIDRCFLSYEDLMEFVSHHIVCCYLDAVLLAIIGKDNENRDNLNSLDDRRVSAYILKHAREWFNAYVQG